MTLLTIYNIIGWHLLCTAVIVGAWLKEREERP